MRKMYGVLIALAISFVSCFSVLAEPVIGLDNQSTEVEFLDSTEVANDYVLAQHQNIIVGESHTWRMCTECAPYNEKHDALVTPVNAIGGPFEVGWQAI